MNQTILVASCSCYYTGLGGGLEESFNWQWGFLAQDSWGVFQFSLLCAALCVKVFEAKYYWVNREKQGKSVLSSATVFYSFKGWKVVCLKCLWCMLWKMAFQGLVGANGVELVLPDTSKEDLNAVINFLYTGQVTIQVKVRSMCYKFSKWTSTKLKVSDFNFSYGQCRKNGKTVSVWSNGSSCISCA